MNPTPIVDLHCDLLLYLARVPGASVHTREDIGVTLPYLQAGGVKHQVMAVFSPTQAGSTHWFDQQLVVYSRLVETEPFYALTDPAQHAQLAEATGIGITLALENASVLLEEDEPRAKMFARLDQALAAAGRIAYISLTHHAENRFGGGNYTQVGLKPDGEALLEQMAERRIPFDLSHTSDALAEDALNYIDRHSLNLPVLASHSNFRILRDHPRNLTTEWVEEIIRREGLIGANFLRLFLDGSRPESLLEHIEYGLQHAPKQIAFGADFFYRPGIPDPARQPLFFPEYEDAAQYPYILSQLQARGGDQEACQDLAYRNAQRFVARFWAG
jgi:microsomal dipeptidase-like Zn-dependent dipeptidase